MEVDTDSKAELLDLCKQRQSITSMSYHLMYKTNSWNKESSITGPKDMMTWTQKKQR